MQVEFHQLDRRWEHLRVRHPARQRRLLASLAEAGQQTPIVVVTAEDQAGRYVVIDGYKRIAALEQLGRDTVEAVVWPIRFLDRACGPDAELRREVESLLQYDPQAESFLETHPTEATQTSMPDRQVGPYRILSPLGAGGMGVVYRAHDSKLGRDVALKTLPVEFAADPERLARFRREARTLASLNHPNIAAIYGLEESEGTTCLVPRRAGSRFWA